MSERTFYMAEIAALMQESLAAGQSVRFSPKGVSMLPMLRQGIDSVILSPVSGPLKKYDIPLYRRDDGAYVLHRIVKAGNTYTCIGDNQFILEPNVRQDQVIAVGTGFFRGDREISVSNPGYRLYARLWHWSRPARWIYRKVLRKGKAIIKRICS